MSDTLDLARELIRRPSVTPEDAGCQALIAERLAALGFHVESMPFGEVANLWAVHGEQGPLFAFAGHTDVVPTGPEAHWRTPPFEPTVVDGYLHGRGAADMKGSVAAFVVAVERFIRRYPEHSGRIALLLTSDEEGPARDGTRRVVEELDRRGIRIDHCLVGEPSSTEHVGDVVKIGRRGSLHGHLVVNGIQGHVAYPHLARNPIHDAAPALAELAATRWDDGNEGFPPTSFQISNIHAGTGVYNVIPGTAEVDFNFRFSTELTADAIRERVERILDAHGLDCTVEWHLSGEPFLTLEGALVDATRAAIAGTTGGEPTLSTGGGTSDGRFIAPTGAQVVELGPVNATIHQIDERVRAADLDTLTDLYEAILVRLHG